MRIASTCLRLSAIALLWALGNCQDGNGTTSSAECHVCGVGRIIGRASIIVSTSFGMFTCGGLAGAGLLGHISDCGEAQEVAAYTCMCMPDGSGSVHSPTAAPAAPPTQFECSICGDEKVATLPNAIVTMPGEENRTCADYVVAANNGLITEAQCGHLQPFTEEQCGCSDDTSNGNPPTPVIEREPTEAPVHICPVCGTGMVVGNPSGIVSVPTQDDRTCEELQIAGDSGSIHQEACNFMVPYVRQACMCEFGSPSEPTVPAPSPPVDSYFCNICGEGSVVTNLDGMAFVPTQPDRSCADYVAKAEAGNITETQCDLLQGYLFAPCGCSAAVATSSVPSDMPSMYPTQNSEPTPSPAPTPYFTAQQGCYEDLAQIYAFESAMQDTSRARKYILCPGTTYDIGTVGDDHKITSGQPFLMLRPNVVYQCGEDGSRQNRCVLKGGDFGVVSHYGVFDGVYETVDNVKIRGITFESQGLFATVLEAAGSVSFIDCAFRMQANKAPILIQWKGEGPDSARSMEDRRKLRKTVGPTASQAFYSRMRSHQGHSEAEDDSTEMHRTLQNDYNHVVTFQDCLFTHNSVIDEMAFPGIIENSLGSELNIINCLFENNIYGDDKNAAPFGYAIRSFGPLNIENSCFIDNTFLNFGPVLVFGAAYTSTGNYVQSSQDDLECDFLSLFTSHDDLANDLPTCVDYEEVTCGYTNAPTPAPTEPLDLTIKETQPPVGSDGSRQGSLVATVVLVGLLSAFSLL